jgi:hypothetical protein
VSDALFDLPAAPAAPHEPGPTEVALRAQLDVGFDEGRLTDVDRPLAESALVLARVVDTADRIGGLKGGYLAAQAQPALQKALHALRLPAELTAAPVPSGGGSDLRSFLGDAFGTPE